MSREAVISFLTSELVKIDVMQEGPNKQFALALLDNYFKTSGLMPPQARVEKPQKKSEKGKV